MDDKDKDMGGHQTSESSPLKNSPSRESRTNIGQTQGGPPVTNITLTPEREGPWAVCEGPLKIGDLEIQSYVLNDGRRVLSGRSITNALGLKGRGRIGVGAARFAEARYLQPFMEDDLRTALRAPIEFATPGGGAKAIGIEASSFPKLCNSIQDAAAAGALRADQQLMAERAKIISRGLSIIGIVAMVDEATGYQYLRPRWELEKILQRYLNDERGVWAKRFPDRFYQRLFRLRGWQYNEMSVKRPSYVGKLTNDIIYQRLAPGVMERLRELVPRDSRGRLKWHLFQHLTEDVGLPELDKHLHAVIALMEASTTWAQFERMLNRAFPKMNATLMLALDVDDGAEEEE